MKKYTIDPASRFTSSAAAREAREYWDSTIPNDAFCDDPAADNADKSGRVSRQSAFIPQSAESYWE